MIVHTNALLDAGSNVTLLREYIALILKLQDENETLKIGNAQSQFFKCSVKYKFV